MIPIYPVNALPAATHSPHINSSGLQVSPPLSLYIHIPWCVKKCPYCDFNSHEARQSIPEDAYVDALIADLGQSTPLVWGRKVRSVFFGGGTPSLFSPEAIDRILSHVRMLTPLEYQAEITLEANPGTVDMAHFKGYKEAGVNRVSLGIQSFNEAHLKSLGRIHNAQQALEAAKLAMATFEKVNLDIMYGLPDQTLEQAYEDAQQACALGPAHLSFYHLTLEPNTAFYHSPPELPDDDASADMQEKIESILADHGYRHYETSAFAKSGVECRHNLNYWTFGDYLGIGAGAHSKLSFHDKLIRQARHKHPKRYLEGLQNQAFIDQEWEISPKARPFEFMMNALRLTEGFEKTLFELRTGTSLHGIRKELNQAIAMGFLEESSTHFIPTLKGMRFLNNLLDIFLDNEDDIRN